MLVCYLFHTQLHPLKQQPMHELSIYKGCWKWDIIFLSQWTLSIYRSKWLESPRNKTSVGNFPKWKDIYNSCGAKHSTATISEAEDTPTQRIFSTAVDDEPAESWWVRIWVFATDPLVRKKKTLEIGVLGDNKSTSTHNEPLRQKKASRTWLKTKAACPEKLWSLHPWRSQSTTSPKQTVPAFSTGWGHQAASRASVQTQQFCASRITSQESLMQFHILWQIPIHSWTVSSPNVYILQMYTSVALLIWAPEKEACRDWRNHHHQCKRISWVKHAREAYVFTFLPKSPIISFLHLNSVLWI